MIRIQADDATHPGRPASGVTDRSVRPSPQEIYQSFVREFARSPQRSEMLDRLRHGHQPDEHGWCSHSAHAHHWEQFPCPTVQLTELVDTVGRDEPTDADAVEPHIGGSAVT